MGPDLSHLVVVLDFDGTVTQRDMGDTVCDRFAPQRWHEIDDAWLRGEISLPEAQKKMWAMARATRSEAIAYSLEVGALRPGLEALLDSIEAVGGRAWLASGGFDFYIEALLERRLARFERAYFNRASFEGDRISVEFPHAELACARCAVCKGRVCDAARKRSRRVIFVGDGASDRCAIGRADEIYAVRGSLLDRVLGSSGERAPAFDDFEEIAVRIARG